MVEVVAPVFQERVAKLAGAVSRVDEPAQKLVGVTVGVNTGAAAVTWNVSTLTVQLLRFVSETQ